MWNTWILTYVDIGISQCFESLFRELFLDKHVFICQNQPVMPGLVAIMPLLSKVRCFWWFRLALRLPALHHFVGGASVATAFLLWLFCEILPVNADEVTPFPRNGAGHISKAWAVSSGLQFFQREVFVTI